MSDRFCPHCSRPLPADATLCPACGRAVGAAHSGRWLIFLVIGAGTAPAS
jgi:RNA polymerase subunit RPABC4/transcription elongation factor Spt4